MKHLRELLREEQEPFALQTYIDERRCQLRRHKRNPPLPPSTPPFSLPLQATSSSSSSSELSSSTGILFSPSTYVKECPLLELASKNPSAAFRAAACFLLEAALGIHGSEQQKQQKRTKKKARSVKQLGLRLSSSLLQKISEKKPRSVIECAHKFPTKHLVTDCRKPQITLEKCYLGSTESKKTEILLKDSIIRVKPEAFECESASLENELKSPLTIYLSSSGSSSSSAVMPINERETVNNDLEGLSSETVSVEGFSLTSSQDDSDRTTEPSSPAAAVEQGTNEGQQRQLFSGGSGNSVVVDNDGMKAEKQHEDDIEKQQLSPVSVLEPPFIDHDHEDEDNHEEEDIAADDMVVEVVESFQFQQSLDLVQRTKDQVMRQIRRFERLAGLDPLELGELLSEEQQLLIGDDDNVDEGHDCKQDKDETEERNRNFDEQEIYEFAKELLELPESCNWERKFPMDMLKLLSDLIELDSTKKEFTSPIDLDTIVCRVHGRFGTWKQVSDSQNMEMLVRLDFRQEGECWKTFGYEVQEFGAQIELAIFDLLVSELID